jgi:predicted TIM-barrel fold metal-dependent hydrolase
VAPADLIIDTDTHVSEPPDLWTSRLPASFGDRALHVEWDDQAQAEVWVTAGRVIGKAWRGAMYGWPEPFPSAPPRQSDAHPASYDASARVAAMDDCGVRAEVLYPNVAGGFTVDLYSGGADREFTVAHIRAYNDFLLDWISVAPERFVPLAIVPYWWIDEAVAEVERCASLGHRGLVTTGAPHLHGQPYMSDHYWDPLWSVCQDAGLPVNFHAANGDMSVFLAPARIALDGGSVTYARSSTGAFFDNAQQLNDLVLCGVLARFPDLKFVSVESGLGWIPFLLESSDYHFKRASTWKEHPEFGDALPSDLFHRQVYVNYWFERLEQWHIDAIGADNILFETDFPHPTCLYGEEITDALNNGLQLQPDEIRRKILWQNAARLYRVDLAGN